MFFIERIPKTRSGKLLRRIVRHILNDEQYKFPSTIDDVTTLKIIERISRSNGFEKNVFKPDQKFKI